MDFFTQAIAVAPENHVLYSNRSASQVRRSQQFKIACRPIFSPFLEFLRLDAVHCAILPQAKLEKFDEALKDAKKVRRPRMQGPPDFRHAYGALEHVVVFDPSERGIIVPWLQHHTRNPEKCTVVSRDRRTSRSRTCNFAAA